MNFDDIYGSDYLKPEDLGSRAVQLTIINIAIDTVRDRETGEEKPQLVLHFHGTKKKIGLSRVNATRVAEWYGKDYMNEWIGKSIILQNENVTAFGKTGPVVRVREKVPDVAQPTNGGADPFSASQPAPGSPTVAGAAVPDVPVTGSGPAVPAAPGAPQSVEQGVAQAAADPFAEVGRPPPDGASQDDFDDDIPF